MTIDEDDEVLVLNGFKTTDVEKDGETEKEKDGETDFVIASWKRKHIYIIESKHNPIKDVADQLKRAKEYIDKYFGNYLAGWKIVLRVYFHTCKENVFFCENCEHFVLTKVKNYLNCGQLKLTILTMWTQAAKTAATIFLNFCFFSQHAHKEPVSKAAVVEKLHSTITSTVGKKDNIILWNKEQLTINSYKNAKQLIICGPFDSGKTVLLKEKAKEVAEKLKKEKILQEQKGEVQQQPPENVHFLTLRQVNSNTITLDTKVENNIHTK